MSRRARYAPVPITIAEQTYAPLRHSKVAPPAGKRSWYQSEGSVVLCDEQGAPRVCLVCNRHNEQFPVTCSRLSDGRIRFMHGVSEADMAFVGLPLSASDRHDVVRAVFSTLQESLGATSEGNPVPDVIPTSTGATP